MLSPVPDDAGNIKHTLVIGYKEEWSVCGEFSFIASLHGGSRKQPAFNNEKIKGVYRFLMKGVTPYSITKPLDAMENKK